MKQKFFKMFFSFVITCSFLSVTFSSSIADTLTISIWGGGYGNMWKKHVAEPFEKKTGHKVIIDALGLVSHASKRTGFDPEGDLASVKES